VNDAPERRPGFRADIQGLRAIAVLLVLAYHARPDLVPGGFVGVDVFFVISGFLIAQPLAVEAARTGRVRLAAFWGRRIRRLMPAAALVIVVALGLGLWLSSVTRWESQLWQAFASATSWQNWFLADRAVDYLHASDPAGPLQHFWSLSVEEQFYVAVPLLLALLAVLVPRRLLGAWRIVLVAAFAVSLAWSIGETALDPDIAYFSTATRAWEFLLGAGVAAFAGRLAPGPRLGQVLGGAGVVIVLASGFVIGPDWAFPSWTALVPTLGAALAILGGIRAGAAGPVTRALGLPPLRYVGDISYSLYLWHWPVIWVTLAALRDRNAWVPPLWVPVVIAVSLACAVLSYELVERPFLGRPVRIVPRLRLPVWRRPTLRGTAVLGGALLALVGVAIAAALAVKPLAEARYAADTDPRNFAGARIYDPDFDASAWRLGPVAPIPDPATLEHRERQLTPACMSVYADPGITTCDWGSDDPGAPLVLLLGDSHAAQWAPAFDDFGKVHGWRVVLAAKQACPITTASRFAKDGEGDWYDECVAWNAAIMRMVLAERPALVVTAAFDDSAPGWAGDGYAESQIAGYAELIRCVEAADPVTRDCATQGTAVEASWARLAATRVPGVVQVDPAPYVCPGGVCPAIIGNVRTYRDDSHLSIPYVQSLEWLLEPAVRQAAPGLF